MAYRRARILHKWDWQAKTKWRYRQIVNELCNSILHSETTIIHARARFIRGEISRNSYVIARGVCLKSIHDSTRELNHVTKAIAQLKLDLPPF